MPLSSFPICSLHTSAPGRTLCLVPFGLYTHTPHTHAFGIRMEAALCQEGEAQLSFFLPICLALPFCLHLPPPSLDILACTHTCSSWRGKAVRDGMEGVGESSPLSLSTIYKSYMYRLPYIEAGQTCRTSETCMLTFLFLFHIQASLPFPISSLPSHHSFFFPSPSSPSQGRRRLTALCPFSFSGEAVGSEG